MGNTIVKHLAGATWPAKTKVMKSMKVPTRDGRRETVEPIMFFSHFDQVFAVHNDIEFDYLVATHVQTGRSVSIRNSKDKIEVARWAIENLDQMGKETFLKRVGKCMLLNRVPEGINLESL